MRIPAYSILVVLFLLASCKSKMTLDTLKEKVTAVLEEQPGDFAVAFKDMTTGEELLINEREIFHAASTMKTPVLIEVCKQANEGKFLITDSLLIKNEFHSIVDSSTFSLDIEDDSEKELYNRMGERRRISMLTYDMIIRSSNLATNLIIEKVGAKNVTETMRALGAKDIQVLRGVEDSLAFHRGLINTTTAYDLMVIFEKISKGQAVSADACETMINILLDQKFNDIIPAKLPKDVKVAHKTGSISGVNHDSGIVILPGGRRYVLVLLSKNNKDEKSAKETMATVSELIYQYVASQEKDKHTVDQ